MTVLLTVKKRLKNQISPKDTNDVEVRDACNKKKTLIFVFSRQGVERETGGGEGGGQIKIVFKIPTMSDFFIELGKK